MLTYDFNGRLAIVTGGAGGLGIAIARALLAANARVQLWDHSAAALENAAEELDGAITTACVDITDEEAVRAAAKVVPEVAMLINNAGILGPVAPSWEVDAATFRRVIDVNLTGAFIVSGAVVPLMLAAGTKGRIVNVSSIQGKEGMPLASAYAASKAGLIALTKTMGKELAESGILVNAVTPAAMAGAMMDKLSDDRRNDILARIPMRRFVTAEEIAAQILWLCSDECSFATGAVFDLSGGRATY